MTRLLVRLVLFLLLAGLEALLARQMAFPFHVPLLAPFVAAATMQTARSEAMTLALLAGVAREPWSGLPPFIGILSILAPCGILIGLHMIRPHPPKALAAVLAAVAYACVMALLHAFTNGIPSFTYAALAAVVPGALVGAGLLIADRLTFLWRPSRLPLLLARTPEQSFISPAFRGPR